ncbi:MAG: penicillin synthase [Rhodospirillaceae bacterium]|nr:penicillin synthase [Rhodospirillaceae bacterium]|tara:strand:+ start:5006 stop:5971 length:966 start_codon:yes stop_codon:yes gene_type:complete
MIIYSEPKTASNIPVIDIGPSFSDDQSARELIAAEVGNACRDNGFFYISNHGVDQSLIDGAFAEANRFFDQPAEWKDRWKKQGFSNGYEPPETQRLDNESPGDIKESFNFTMGNVPGTPGYKANIWPEDFPEFRERLEAYEEGVWRAGLQVSRLISLSLEMPFNYFDDTFAPQKSPLRILRYPPHPSDAKFNQLGCGAHTDWGWITLLSQDSLGGLEIETASGDWVRVDPIPGTFVVNLGDIMLRWTNGQYHSSLHRVMNNRSGRNRHSIVLFFNQAHETHVECLPTCLTPGEIPKFPPCTAGEHSTQRYNESRPQIDVAQ